MKTITVETSQLSGPALDWAVAKAENVDVGVFSKSPYAPHLPPRVYLKKGNYEQDDAKDFFYFPSSNWRQGGPLIGRISSLTQDDAGNWYAIPTSEYEVIELSGQTPLIAACRAIVAAELGDEVEVPGELVG